MTFTDVMPFVLPFVRHLPSETVEHHIRLAAHRFFGKTHAWQAELDPVLGAAGIKDYTFNLEPGEELAYLIGVSIGGQSDVEIINAGVGFKSTNGGRSRYRAWTVNRADLRIDPAPEQGALIEVLAALRPTVTDSTEFPSEYDQYVEIIADGALSTLMKLPSEDRDLTLAAETLARFETYIASVGFSVSLGTAGARLKPTGRFY